MKTNGFFFLLAVGILMVCGDVRGAEDSKGAVVVLTGDSTVAKFPAGHRMRGWGQLLPRFLNPGVDVLNFAVPGLSTKTFREQGHWDKVLGAGGDFILIQFGHNDSHPSAMPESTRADGDFQTNLEAYVKEAREAGAVPVLVTPMHRRVFKEDGKMSRELEPYAEAVKTVAQKLDVPVIDLYGMSGELFESLGEEGSSELTVPEDQTHFTEAGAEKMAELVARGLRQAGPELAALVPAGNQGK
jgi:lysophospholipase L1-like esterase